MTDWMIATRPNCSSRPQMSDPRRTGVTRKRSMIPPEMSSMRLMPLQPAEKKAVMTTMPGVRKSMYDPASKPGISTIFLKRAP